MTEKRCTVVRPSTSTRAVASGESSTTGGMTSVNEVDPESTVRRIVTDTSVPKGSSDPAVVYVTCKPSPETSKTVAVVVAPNAELDSVLGSATSARVMAMTPQRMRPGLTVARRCKHPACR